jgi:hypothetical protein
VTDDQGGRHVRVLGHRLLRVAPRGRACGHGGGCT